LTQAGCNASRGPPTPEASHSFRIIVTCIIYEPIGRIAAVRAAHRFPKWAETRGSLVKRVICLNSISVAY
jgi:hypothetical protein